MSGLELISVHMPKCAGTSFRQSLIAAYSEPAVRFDYSDAPLNPSSPMNLDPEGFFAEAANWQPPDGIKAIHGHFHIHKYNHIKASCLRATFLRHPVDRLISHYFYWLNTPKHNHRLHDYVLDKGLTLTQFARLPMLRYSFTGGFFKDVDMGIFDFIGLHERYQTDIDRLAVLLGRPLPSASNNLNPQPDYDQKKRALVTDPAIMAELTHILAKDIGFYEALCDRLG